MSSSFPAIAAGDWASKLMAVVMAHPDLPGLRRFMLATRDAHGLYRQFGFTEPKNPQLLMERHVSDIYQQTKRR
jgi:N-acetylglutamate synthase-like GNAT family acetyltransferase